MKNTKGGGAPRLKKIYIRTMNSDKQSIKNQGGGEPKPYQPSDEGNDGGNNNTPQNPSTSQGQSPNNDSGGGMNQPSGSGNNAPGMPGSSGMPNTPSQQGQGGGGLGKPGSQDSAGQGGPANIPSPPGGDGDFQKNFQQSKQGGSSDSPQGGMTGGGQAPGSMGDGGSQPPKDFSQDDLSGDEYPPKKKSNKKLFIILLIIILALGAAVAVYFLFLSPAEPADNAAADQNQEEQTEEMDDQQATSTNEDSSDSSGDVQIPTVPSATSSDDESTTTQDSSMDQGDSEQSSQPSGAAADTHESLLSTPADTESDIVLDSMSLASLDSALSFSPTEVPLFREVILQDSSESLVSFGDIAQMIAPSVFTNEIVDQFQSDATFVTYTNDSGTWFGLAVQLESDADTQSVQGQVASLEDNISEVQNFFISEPGAASAWQDGGAGDVASRYVTFDNEGASFNYGWDGDTLIIGTSYSTFQQIVNHL